MYFDYEVEGYSNLETKVNKYCDLSAKKDFKDALHNLYQSLRDCEIVEGVKLILVCYTDEGYSQGEYGATLFDKIFRSASGEQYILSQGQLYN